MARQDQYIHFFGLNTAVVLNVKLQSFSAPQMVFLQTPPCSVLTYIIQRTCTPEWITQVLHNNVSVHHVSMQKCVIKGKSQPTTDGFLDSEKCPDFKLTTNSTGVVCHKISHMLHLVI